MQCKLKWLIVMRCNCRPHGCDVTGSHMQSQDQPVDQAAQSAAATAVSQNAGELNGVSSDGTSSVLLLCGPWMPSVH